jgi:hypothetical protein
MLCKERQRLKREKHLDAGISFSRTNSRIQKTQKREAAAAKHEKDTDVDVDACTIVGIDSSDHPSSIACTKKGIREAAR